MTLKSTKKIKYIIKAAAIDLLRSPWRQPLPDSVCEMAGRQNYRFESKPQINYCPKTILSDTLKKA